MRRLVPIRSFALSAVTLAGLWALPVATHAEPSTLLQGLPSLSLSTGPAKEGPSVTARSNAAAALAASDARALAATSGGLSGLSSSLSDLPPTAAGPDAGAAGAQGGRSHAKPRRSGITAPRVLIVTMFDPEAQPWIDRQGPWTRTRIAGLSEEFPWVRCNHSQVCVVTLGMGHANAAASMLALVLSTKLDLRQTYVMVTGMAAINPNQGTLGTPAWARFLVDFGLQWQIDARETPADWPSGYLGINTRSPREKPQLDYNTEVFQLDGNLLRKAYQLSHDVELADAPQAQAARAKYPTGYASQPPRVTQCDTVSGDTWFSGRMLGERAAAWTQLLTNGAGNYCTAQQEDNATYESLQRGARLGRIDLSRVMVLRAGSDFDRPPPGGSAVSNLLDYTAQGGFDIAIENLYRTALPVVTAISGHWPEWKGGPPAN